MKKKQLPPPEMPPMPTTEMTQVQAQTLDQVLETTVRELMGVSEAIFQDHGLADSQAFLLNLISSVVASTVYSTISGPELTAKRDYKVLKYNLQEAVAKGFHFGFLQYAPTQPTDFLCKIDLAPQPPSNASH